MTRHSEAHGTRSGQTCGAMITSTNARNGANAMRQPGDCVACRYRATGSFRSRPNENHKSAHVAASSASEVASRTRPFALRSCIVAPNELTTSWNR